MTYRYIGCKPQLFCTIPEFHVVAAPVFFEVPKAMRVHRPAFDTDPGPIGQRFDLTDQHQRLEIALVLPEARGKIRNPIGTVTGRYFGADDIGVFNVILFAAVITYGKYGEFPAL